MKLKIAHLLLANCLAAAPAAATTITFSGLAAGNPPVVSYTESGFTFTVTDGSFNGTTGNGVPPPSVYTPSDAGTAIVTNGGIFTFSSIALGNGAFSGTANFTLTGLLGGTQLYTFSQGVGAFQFNTYSNSSTNAALSIDTLRIAVSGDGNLDNITVNAVVPVTPSVPEPASWAMMIGGFGLVGAAMRRRKVAVSFA